MTGININDSIVRVTTGGEYAKDRGLIPSIIDGAADRLRPVLLTTLTTVLGLAPLLYEQSQQAQFLKPTVITLVYGLGFGMVLVLLIVPSLLAMQQDVNRQISAMRRGLRGSAAGIKAALFVTWGLVCGWLIATLGWAIALGTLPAPILSVFPAFQSWSPEIAGLALFLIGAAVIALVTYIVAVAGYLLAARRA